MTKTILILTAALTFALGQPAQHEAHSTPLAKVAMTELASRPAVTDADMVIWHRVAWCETHADWDRNQPNFDGALGISRAVWNEYGGEQYAPAPHLATPREQVAIAKRINAGYAVPDAFGCSAW